jgi:hypothetical protein
MINCSFNQSLLSPNNMVFTSCQVPSVSSVLPDEIQFDSLITITGNFRYYYYLFNFFKVERFEFSGSYFSENECENEVYIGGKKCLISSSNSSFIQCTIGKNSGLMPNKNYEIEVLVKNIGNPLYK